MIRVLMLGGTGVIGDSILSIIGNNDKYSISVTSRKQRRSKYKNVQYLCGNANDLNFINTFEDDSYDIVIDFMNYRNEVLESNFSKLVRIANQYMFLSSARVYDNTQIIIDENCSLLFNTTDNIEFKNSGTYAVKKAYQEKFVRENGGRKVTIIRPYKTYSSERLQLGEYEINHWLRRIINDKPIVLNQNVLSKFTSLTDGVDVANGIVGLICNEKAYGETYQIVTSEYMTWNEILELYTSILKQRSFKPIIYLSDDTKEIDQLFEDGYQMPYDIMYDRRFNSAKMSDIKSFSYTSMKEGLVNAISSYLENNTLCEFENSVYDDIVDRYIENNKLVLWEGETHA